MTLHHSFSVAPGRTVILSIIAVILAGTGLLSLPFAQASPHSFIDLLFIAASAVSVTGLAPCTLDTFTLFGKSVILGLIQIGGLGLITLTVFIVSLFFNVGIKTHFLAGQVLELDSWKHSLRIITFIIGLTLSLELIGAVLLVLSLPPETLAEHPWFNAMFHSVSAFCSAGFCIFSKGFIPLAGNYAFLAITAVLILCGGLGFITWYEIIQAGMARLQRKKFRYSLHSRIVLSFTGGLILITSLIYWLLQYSNLLHEHTFAFTAANALFNVIACRSCGFSTLALGTAHMATLVLIMATTFIGSAPGSTGSGIKIPSFTLILATIRSVMSGRSVVEIRGRQIPNDQILKVMTVLALSITCITTTIFFLLISEQDQGLSFLSIVFESFSAFANQGLSLGITPTLSTVGKCILIVTMILGRIGALTLILSIRRHKERAHFQYPEERVMLG